VYLNEIIARARNHSLLLSTLIMDAAAEKPEEDINAYVPFEAALLIVIFFALCDHV
jgi:hypothetical protein